MTLYEENRTSYVKAGAIAAALALSKHKTAARARKECWPCVKRKGMLLYPVNRLPNDVIAALHTAPEVPPEDAVGLSQLTDKAREEAKNRSAFLHEFHRSGLKPAEFLEAYSAGFSGAYLRDELGAVSVRTLYRWLREHKEAGGTGTAALAALAPRHGVKKGGAGASLDPFQRMFLRRFWLQGSRPAMAHAWRNLLKAYPHKKCTYNIAARFLQSIHPKERDYYRLGKKRFENLYMPYVEQNISRYSSLDLVVSDHCVLDCVVTYRGKLIRPWLTTFQDYRSGKILGYFPSVKPSSLSIIAAYYMCCIRYGVPKAALFDNGRDYRSKLLNGCKAAAKQFTPEGVEEETEVFFHGILPALGTEVHFTRPYSGKSKGRQERYYRLLGEYLAKDIGSYIGSDTTTKPEDAALMWRSINGAAKREDVPTWEYFVKAASAMIECINDTFASQGKGMDGKTRSRVFEENLPQTIRRASKEELQQALYRSEVRRCGRNGVKHHGVNYYHPALIGCAGQDVVIRNKIITDSEMPVYALDGSFICTAVANYFAEGGNLQRAIERVESVKKHTLLSLAERGTNEVCIEADRRIMINAALQAYDEDLPSLEELFGEPEALPAAAGAENIQPPARQTKYISELDAGADYILHIGGKE